MKEATRKLLSCVLTLCLLVGLFAAMPQATYAAAANLTWTPATDGSKSVSELTGYTAGNPDGYVVAIVGDALAAGAALTVDVAGVTVTSNSAAIKNVWIAVTAPSLTISDLNLTSLSDTTTISFGAAGALNVLGDCTINTASVSSGMGRTAIFSSAALTVNVGDAALTATGGSTEDTFLAGDAIRSLGALTITVGAGTLDTAGGDRGGFGIYSTVSVDITVGAGGVVNTKGGRGMGGATTSGRGIVCGGASGSIVLGGAGTIDASGAYGITTSGTLTVNCTVTAAGNSCAVLFAEGSGYKLDGGGSLTATGGTGNGNGISILGDFELAFTGDLDIKGGATGVQGHGLNLSNPANVLTLSAEPASLNIVGGSGYSIYGGNLSNTTTITTIVFNSKTPVVWPASYGLTLSQTSTHTFAALPESYSTNSLTPLDVTITNTGNVETSVSAALSGANAGSFSLTDPAPATIPATAGNTATFTVIPNAGLGVGTYLATVTVSGSGSVAETFDVSFTVTDATAPILSGESAVRQSKALAEVSITSNEDCTLYYVVQETTAAPPTDAMVQASNDTAAAAVGVNTINLATLSSEAAKTIYIMGADAAGNWSTMSSVGIAEVPQADTTQNAFSVSNGLSQTAGVAFTITATGHRQNEQGAIIDETRYVPMHAEFNPTALFVNSAGAYAASVTAAAPGTYTLRITFRLERWDGTRWVDTGAVHVQTAELIIKAMPSAPATGDSGNLGISIMLLGSSVLMLGVCLLLHSKQRRVKDAYRT